VNRKDILIFAVGGALGLLLVGATAGLAGQTPKTAAPNPDAGLTDAQRNQAYQANTLQFQKNYADWIARLDVSKLSLRSLRHGELNGSPAKRPTSMSESVALGDLVIAGTVKAISPAGIGLTNAKVTVDRTLKGSVRATVTILQSGGLYPTEDWKDAYILDAPGSPALLPGDHVVVVLKASAAIPNEFELQSFTGIYQIKSGRVEPIRGNPFGPAIEGKTESALNDAILASLHK